MAAVFKILSGDGARAKSDAEGSDKRTKQKNAQRVLILSSRGITSRHRHLLNDLATLLPHGRREPKFDSKKKLHYLNELAELYNCNNVLFLEARKHQDLYMYLAKAPNGPTAKFHIQNLHTMEELNFIGNCLKGSRPILSFDAAFDQEPHLQLLRELFIHVFGAPPNARKIKPFIDRVMGFSLVDGKIWVRQYQVVEEDIAEKNEKEKDEKNVSLLEIGPRFCMTLIVIQEGSFSGPILYQNTYFVSPNQVRSDLRRRDAKKHNARKEQDVQRLAKKDQLGIRTNGREVPNDALDPRELFA
ncbi:Brix domain-containing protein [Xylariaceae sp. FL1651]|nr:Brix domain-containing protein [Xylariaceae sp. FL1651]